MGSTNSTDSTSSVFKAVFLSVLFNQAVFSVTSRVNEDPAIHLNKRISIMFEDV